MDPSKGFLDSLTDIREGSGFNLSFRGAEHTAK
jgi:hypothetical protein